MSFKHSCFTNNTPEAREWLEEIGYKFVNLSNDGTCIFSDEDGEAFFANGNGYGQIDCLGNLPLFKALTAVRDDSDYLQWFTDGKDWFLCEIDCFYPVLMKKENYHKSTKEEIIEHFKIKEDE